MAISEGSPQVWADVVATLAKSPIPLAVLDLSGCFELANPSFEAFVLRSSAALAGKRLTELWDVAGAIAAEGGGDGDGLDDGGEPPGAMATLVARLERQGAVTIVARPPAGSNRPAAMFRFVLVGDAAGRPSRLGVTVIEQHVAEESRTIGRAPDALARAFEQLEVGLLRSTLDGEIVDVNRRLRRLLGYADRSELLALEPFAMVHADDRHLDVAAGLRALAGELASWTGERRWMRRDGTVMRVLQSVTLVRGDRGEPVEFVTQVIDLTVPEVGTAVDHELTARFGALADGMATAVVEIDAAGRVTFANAAARDLLGREAVGLPVAELIHPVDFASFGPETVGVIDGPLDVSQEFRVVRRDGTTRRVRAHSRLRTDGEGRFAGATSGWTDITDEATVRDAWTHLGERYEITDDIVAVAEVTGALLHLNPAGQQVRGPDRSPAQFLHDLFDGGSRLSLSQFGLPSVVRAGSWTGELLIDRGDGATMCASVSLIGHRDVDGVVRQVSMITRDVTRLVEVEARRQDQATTDVLTGLANRVTLFDRLENALHRSGRRDDGLAVLYVDLHGVGGVADDLGPDAGDDVIGQAARRLRAAVRAGDTVARVGSAEFLVLAEPISRIEDAAGIGETILRAFDEPFLVGGASVSIGVNVGIAPSTVDATPRTIVNAADLAVYVAKSRGVGHIEIA